MWPSLLAVAAIPASFADGGLTLAEVDDVVAFHADALEPCRPVKGSLVFELAIDADGGVQRADINRDSQPPRGECIQEQLSSWQFPPRERDTVVRYEWAAKKPTSTDAGTGLALSALKAVQRAHRDEIARCWLQTRRSFENEGAFSTTIVIGRSGAVLDAQAGNTGALLAGLDLGECVARTVRGWRFPSAKRSTQGSLEWLVAHDADRPLASGDPDAVLVTALEGMSPSRRQPVVPPDVLAPCAVHVPSDAQGVFVSLWFTALPDGGHSPAAKSSPKVAELEQCVLSTLRNVARDPADAGEGIQFVWRLSSDGGVKSGELPAQARGGLSKDVIVKVLKRNQNEIKLCYESELQNHPELVGKVAVLFTIGPSGSVLNASVVENTLNEAAARCMVQRISKWQFPAPIGGEEVRVTFPWIFTTAGGLR